MSHRGYALVQAVVAGEDALEDVAALLRAAPALLRTTRTQRYYIAPDSLGGALHRDIVLIAPEKRPAEGGWARVVRVLERGFSFVTGVYHQHGGHGEVVPDEERLGFRLSISPSETALAEDGDRVVVQITRYPTPGKDARGRVTGVVGRAGDALSDNRAIAIRFGFPLAFSAGAEEEASRLAAPPLSRRAESSAAAPDVSRLDLRDRLIFTIDGADAKDFDDAVSMEVAPHGHRLGVHIADVSSYVEPAGALDEEAYARGTSVYLTGLTLPMLPDALSNGACSLKPDEERLAISCFIDLDSTGRPLGIDIRRSIIRSRARLTYEAVNEFFETGIAPGSWPEGLARMLTEMRALALVLKDRRVERGSLDFDFPEVRVALDRNNHPLDIFEYRRGDAEKLIEEFMIACNEAVASHLFHLGMPCMFRVHERPDKQDLDDLNETLAPMGHRIRGTNNPHPKAVQAVLEQAKGTPEETIVADSVLRALKKARYSAVWLGHFGLSSPLYCHFTSPIRRYPDLMVHRIVGALLDGVWKGDDYPQVSSLLRESEEHCSEREQASEAAERESLENMKYQYARSKVGDIFTGVVTQVAPFGLFVEIKGGITGLVHVSALGPERYEFDEVKKALVGTRSRTRHRAGETVAVQVLRFDPVERHVELRVIQEEAMKM
jgi:ribonuclease R